MHFHTMPPLSASKLTCGQERSLQFALHSGSSNTREQGVAPAHASGPYRKGYAEIQVNDIVKSDMKLQKRKICTFPPCWPYAYVSFPQIPRRQSMPWPAACHDQLPNPPTLVLSPHPRGVEELREEVKERVDGQRAKVFPKEHCRVANLYRCRVARWESET